MATIYLIAPLPVLNCDVNNVYVGSTTQRLRQRWAEHKSGFIRWRNGVHTNCSSFRLFEKYGVENCTIIEIEQCSIETRKERESYWIGFHNAVNQFRLSITAHGGSKEYWSEYSIQHREERNKMAIEYYNKNREELNKNKNEWRKENRDKHNEYMRSYRARKKAENLAKSGCTHESVNSLPEVQLA